MLKQGASELLCLSECFESISGEGRYTGYPCVFVRLYGCNLGCSFCDAKYAWKKGKKRRINLENMMSMINQFGQKYVCITGGEPLLQDDTLPLVYELCYFNYIVSIETNGSIPIDKDNYSRSFSYCMDIKCPSSGMAKHNVYGNLENLGTRDEVKFVISDYNDYLFAKGVLKQYHTMASVIFSPCFNEQNESNAKELAEWIVADKLNVKLGIQIHKIIGVK